MGRQAEGAETGKALRSVVSGGSRPVPVQSIRYCPELFDTRLELYSTCVAGAHLGQECGKAWESEKRVGGTPFSACLGGYVDAQGSLHAVCWWSRGLPATASPLSRPRARASHPSLMSSRRTGGGVEKGQACLPSFNWELRSFIHELISPSSRRSWPFRGLGSSH